MLPWNLAESFPLIGDTALRTCCRRQPIDPEHSPPRTDRKIDVGLVGGYVLYELLTSLQCLTDGEQTEKTGNRQRRAMQRRQVQVFGKAHFVGETY
jgi:hypothetical protein